MANMAIIPARGGSKRIPRKNIREFMGRPMISYAISAALESDVFEEVMVSTDDAEIAAVARDCGAAVPFMRSRRNSGDNAGTLEVVQEVLSKYADTGKVFEVVACIYPCAPFLTGDILQSAYRRFSETDVDLLLPVVQYSHPVQRAMQINGEGLLVYREPAQAGRRTQDLEPMFHDVGMFYFAKASVCESGDIRRRGCYEISSLNSQDIDTMEDWRIAEIKYKVLQDAQDRT